MMKFGLRWGIQGTGLQEVQVCNIDRHNSPLNTVPFLVYKAGDTYPNMTTALRPFSTDFDKIFRMTWNNKFIFAFYIWRL